MVLSNKKLKQKVRAELAQSQAENADLTPQPHASPKNLLDSSTSKLRLSKREKRRKVRSLKQDAQEGADGRSIDGNKADEGMEKNNKNKKRKRKSKVEDGGASIDENKEDEGTEKNNKKKRKSKVENGVASIGENKEDEGTEKNNNNKKQKSKVEDGVANGVAKDVKKSNKRHNKKKKAKTAEKSGANPGDDKLEASELNQSNSSEQNGDDPTKVYVGGIPFYSTEDDIRSYFEGCGTIIEVDAMKFPESGKFRGIAIISFKTEAAAKRALALDGSDMGGLFLKIQPYKTIRIKASDFTPKRVEGYNRIYVGNLPWDTTEDQLRNLLSNCSISSIRFGTDKGGYAHVDFTDSQSMKRALTMDQKILCGRPVRISCAVPLKKAKSHAIDMPTSNGVDGEKSSSIGSGKMPTSNGVDGEKSTSIGSGKMRRRTCYECGEKGHISSLCPKKQAVDSSTS
ncbi:protein gar2-like [Senna tora]|uniref:Protein gar2-like n=1 Tax=Senna tora TaxID=362788 RepID=A0A834SY43_9FABA|nr:protein gar2-like [Senna tora]